MPLRKKCWWCGAYRYIGESCPECGADPPQRETNHKKTKKVDLKEKTDFSSKPSAKKKEKDKKDQLKLF